MPFCPNCGKPTNMPEKFCTNCGHKLSPQTGSVPLPSPLPVSPGGHPGPAPAPGSPAIESVLGVIGGLELKRSLLKSEPVNIVVTGSRLLCVPVAGLVETASQQAGDTAKSERKWFIAQGKAKNDVVKTSDFSAYFLSRSPEDILGEFPGGIVISIQDLVQITIRRRHMDLEGDTITTTFEDWPLGLKTSQAEYSLVSRTDPAPGFLKNAAVNTLIGNRIRVL